LAGRPAGAEDDVLGRGDRAKEMHSPPRWSGWVLQFEEAPGHHRDGRSRGVRESSGKTDAIEEVDMTVEDEESTEQTVEAEQSDVELHATPELPDDDVEAHVWRAQS
jgi:hypothetical protein